jgi:hypothetical protein
VVEAERVLASGKLDAALINRFLATKYSHWRYEHESRLFTRLPKPDPDTGLYFAPFSEELRLTAVIVGALSPASRAQVHDVLGDLAGSVKTIKARLAFRTFRVVRQRKASLWT